MMKFDLKRRPALWTSIGLHLLVLLLAALFTFISFPETPDSTHVFEMLASDQMASELLNPATEPQTSASADLKLSPLPNLPRLKPAPAPPAPEVKSPPVSVKEMSYEEFNRLHGTRSPNPKPMQANPRPQRLPHVNTDNIRKNLEQSLQTPLSHTPGSTSKTASAIDAYGAKVNQLLNRVWVKPAQLTGGRLSATVVFAVSAAGQIMQPRFSPSSGNAAFDRSVLEAFRRVGFVGVSPNGQKNTFKMTFRMLD